MGRSQEALRKKGTFFKSREKSYRSRENGNLAQNSLTKNFTIKSLSVLCSGNTRLSLRRKWLFTLKTIESRLTGTFSFGQDNSPFQRIDGTYFNQNLQILTSITINRFLFHGLNKHLSIYKNPKGYSILHFNRRCVKGENRYDYCIFANKEKGGHRCGQMIANYLERSPNY